MAFTLCLNSSNVVYSSNNSSFKYNFISGNYTAKDAQICISTLTMPYSFYNVSSAYNNKLITISFPTTASATTNFAFTIPDGFYTIDTLQLFLQTQMIANSLYLINATGDYEFYLSLQYNPTFYAVQLVVAPVPISLPAGYTQPAGWNGYRATSVTPTLILPASGSVSAILGFVAGASYPTVPASVSTSISSSRTPIGSTVNSLVARCSFVNNPISVPSDILDGFAINSTFGSNIVFDPSFEHFVDIRDGTYNSLTFTIVDQNLNPIVALDPNVSIVLMIRQKALAK